MKHAGELHGVNEGPDHGYQAVCLDHDPPWRAPQRLADPFSEDRAGAYKDALRAAEKDRAEHRATA